MLNKRRRTTWLFVLGLAVAVSGALAETAAPTTKPAPAAITPEEEALLAAAEPPPIPPGFTSEQEVLGAILERKLTLLSPLMAVPIPHGVVELKDIEYGRVGERALLLDLYLPEGLDRPRPGLIFIHGGGWEGGKRSDYKYYTVRYGKRGYVVATISYRLVQEAPFPACVQDAKCAVRWMRANAEKYHVDPNKIGVFGGSAGGHLALMVGYSSDVAELEGEGGHAEYSSAVQAVVDFYGPVDLTLPIRERDRQLVRNFFGGKSYDEAPAQYALASPMTHLDNADPPTLIFHGTIDDLVPVAQSDLLAAKLEELGIPHAYERIEGYPHAMDMAKEINIHCRWYTNRFLAKYLPIEEETAP